MLKKPIKDPTVKNPNTGLKVFDHKSRRVGRTFSENRWDEGRVYVHFEQNPEKGDYAKEGEWVEFRYLEVLQKLTTTKI